MSKSLQPIVSAVIPTLRRPDMVLRAVRSVLNQSLREIEAIVVVDGPDAETVSALKSIADPRLRVIALEQNVGGSEARNVGIRAAQGQWIGLLDDDDEWLPPKVATQRTWAEASKAKYPVLGSCVIARSPVIDQIWPRRLPRRDERIDEYLFCRKGVFYGDAFLQTSTFFAARELMLAVPFKKGLKRHQDWDWLLRIGARTDVSIELIPEPLAIFYVEEPRASVAKSLDWEFSLDWANANIPAISPRAFSFFIATECVPRASLSGAGFGVYMRLLREFFFKGKPSLNALALFIAFWTLPERRRRQFRDAIRKSRQKLHLLSARHRVENA